MINTSIDRIEINGEKYIKESAVKEAAKVDGMEYCIVRTYSAGVFAGYIESRNGKEVVLRNSRRLWYWEGACSLSELAMCGTKEPQKCKFAVEVDKTILTEVIEIISVTGKAKKSIDIVQEWIYEK